MFVARVILGYISGSVACGITFGGGVQRIFVCHENSYYHICSIFMEGTLNGKTWNI
jgi:hypothetical protein